MCQNPSNMLISADQFLKHLEKLLQRQTVPNMATTDNPAIRQGDSVKSASLPRRAGAPRNERSHKTGHILRGMRARSGPAHSRPSPPCRSIQIMRASRSRASIPTPAIFSRPDSAG